MWLSGWDKRIELEIDYTNKIGASVSWFPVTIHLKDANGDSTKVFEEVGANSRKIAITKADGETELKGEIELWDYDSGTPANSVAIIHTSATGWTIDGDTSIYLYYDSTHADNANIGTTPGSSPVSDVWDDNFVAVYHLNNDPTINGTPVKDSTSRQYHGFSEGSMGAGDVVDAKIGKGLDFDGNDRIKLPTGARNDSRATGKLTLEAWIKPPSTPGGDHIISLPSAESGTGVSVFYLAMDNGADNLNFTTVTVVGTTSTNFTYTDTSIFHHVAGRYDGASQELFYDGNQEDTQIQSGAFRSTSGILKLGDFNGTYPRYWVGLMDEARISDVDRSDAWIKGSYNSGNDSLLTYGNEAIPPVGPANLKTVNTIAIASVKSINGVAIASVKSVNGIT